MVVVAEAQMDRYSRHLALPGFEVRHQRALRAADVVVVGAGGLGAPVIQYLAGAGIGRLRIVDNDRVDATNLQRQVLFGDAEVGTGKAQAAARRAQWTNPEVTTQIVDQRLEAANIDQVLAGADLVVDCTDNLATRYVMQRHSLAAGIGCVWAAIGQYSGRCSVVLPQAGACVECLYGPADQVSPWPGAAEGGVFGPACGVLGALSAAEAIKVLTGLGQPLVSRLAMVDTWRAELSVIDIHPDPACQTCALLGRRLA
jgi:adenylyltransferase/sulfurtransferase